MMTRRSDGRPVRDLAGDIDHDLLLLLDIIVVIVAIAATGDQNINIVKYNKI